MPRTDREVAQRYAAKKRRKRVSGSPVAPAAQSTRYVQAGEDDVSVTRTVESSESAVAAPPSAPTRRATPVVRIAASTRRPFSSYATEYSYVTSDLKRVAVVAGGLLLMLVILSLFVQ